MNKLAALILICLASYVDAHMYAPSYGYYPTQQGGWTLGSFNIADHPTIVVWIRQDETVVDGFVVPRTPKNQGENDGRAKYVAKAICVLGNCKSLDPSQEAEVVLLTEDKDNVHISILPPGVNPESDLSKYISNTHYYPVRRIISTTANYVPSFLDPPLPKPKPLRRLGRPIENKNRYEERKTQISFDNTPKTVKLNGFEAPAILPRPKPSTNRLIITKKDYKKRTNAPTTFLRPRSSTNRLIVTQNDYVKRNEASSRISRPKPSSNRLIITKKKYEDRKFHSGHTNSRISNNIVSKPAKVAPKVSYDLARKNFVYNDFYI